MPGFKVFGTEQGVAVPNVLLKHQWEIVKLGPIQINDTSPARYAKEVELPKISFEEEQVRGAALIYKFASMAKWEDVNVTFYDTEGLAAQIESWRKLVYSDENGLGLASDYKQTSKFRLIDRDASGSTLVMFTLNNSWPKTIGYGQLTYTDSDAKIISLTLSYDYAVIE
jgi:hypothetical protein